MPRRHIKTVAYGLFRYADMILVQQIDDKKFGRAVYRPLSVEVQFGERGHETLTKEIEAELGVKISRLKKTGVLELISSSARRKTHEVAFMYDGSFQPCNATERPFLIGYKGRDKVTAVWKAVADFLSGKDQMRPEVFMQFIKAPPARSSAFGKPVPVLKR